MARTRYRLALAVPVEDMAEIANCIGDKFPELAKAIEKQWLEILNSGVNVFGPFEHSDGEPLAGMTTCEIELMTGIKD